ncbi:MAG: MFS transporter [Coriobacteriia bacterium]|nr:MFS transporter [Coriobacteriia bacterium]
MSQRGPEAVARNRLPLLTLFAANGISMVGNMLATIAIPWYVLETTGSAARTGLAGFFTILPVVVAGFLGGTLVDRLGYKRTSIISDLASGVTVAMIPLLHLTVGLQFWQLMVLVFFGALLDAPGSTARKALIPDLADVAGMSLDRATSIHQVVERSSRMAGAPLAGLLIALIGTANVLWLDSVSFFVSAGMVAVGVFAAHAPRENATSTKYWADLRTGLRFVRRDTLILSIVLVVMVTNFLDSAFSGVILPVYVSEVFGSALNLGLIIAAGGAGAVLGALAYGVVGPRLPRHGTFVAAFVLVTLNFWALALEWPLAPLLAIAFVSGMGAGPINPIISAVSFERIPGHMRGRVLGTITAGAWVAMPLGVLVGGLLTERFGVHVAVVTVGAVYVAVALSMLAIPAMRQMDREPA